MDNIQRFIEGDYPGDEQELLSKALDMLEVMREALVVMSKPIDVGRGNIMTPWQVPFSGKALEKCEKIARGDG